MTVVFVGPRAPLTVPMLAPLWRLASALGSSLARVVLMDRGGGDSSILIPGFESRTSDPDRPEAELVGAALADVAAAERHVVVVATPELADWPAAEIDLLDEYAAQVVARFATSARRVDDDGEGSGCAGAALLNGERLADLDALDLWPGGPAHAARPPFNLVALRRLRDLDVPAAEVAAELAVGKSGLHSWVARTRGSDSPRLALDRVDLPRRGSAGAAVRIALEGWAVALPPVRRLVLAIGDRRYPFAVDLARDDVAARTPFLPDTRCGFRLTGRFGPFAPGRHTVALERIDGRRLRRLGALVIGATAPEPERGAADAVVTILRCAVRAIDGRSTLTLAGELESEAPVHSLRVEIDGRRAFDVDRRRFVPAPSAAGVNTWTWHLDQAVTLTPGAHELLVSARREQAAMASVACRFEVPFSVEAKARIVCDELERWRRDAPAPVWGSVRLAGRLEACSSRAEIELWAAGERVAVAVPDEEGDFALRHPLVAGRATTIELVAREDGAAVARSGAVSIVARPAPRLAGASECLTEMLSAFGAEGVGLAAWAPDELVGRAAELAGTELAAFQATLFDLARRSRDGAGRAAGIHDDRVGQPRRPLRVLLASWEIPFSGHGGGVHLRNLIAELGQRHEITLVHPVHPGAEGLSESVRGSVRGILTPLRGWRDPGASAPFDVPAEMLWTESADLRRTLAHEALSGCYDLVNLEGAQLALHAAPGPLPTCVVPLELASYARRMALPAVFADLDSAASALYALVAALGFDCRRVGDRFSTLVTLTRPEAEWWSRFLPGRELFVNPIAVDVERWRALAPSGAAREPAAFVFVGTFRHPPNLAAAEELIDVVAPRLRARLPGAVIRLAGADPPPVLVDRAAAAGVDLLGWVDDLPALLARSTAFLAPLRHGAGMRVKLLEAMAAGCPVITTGLGMTGIAARPDEEFLLADAPDDFVAAAISLATLPGRAEAMARAARTLMERDHGIARQAERRERIWAAMLEASGTA